MVVSALPTKLNNGLHPVDIPPRPVRRLSVAEYHVLIEAGFFHADDKYELLEGWVVPKMSRRPPHDVCLGLVGDALRARLPGEWIVRAQSAITTEESEPEPDLAIVPGPNRRYLANHPVPGELALVVEVADSSLADDRLWKGRIYARVGIAVYWIVNLVDDRVEVYTDPTGADEYAHYQTQQDFTASESISLIVDRREYGPVPVAELLP